MEGNDRPSYETISYYWGDSALKCQIEIGGHYMPVPQSTFAALRRVRLPDRPRTVWIDAVCIDQQNIEERGHQVALMRDVYSNSVGNLVYLGEADSTNLGALDSIQAIVHEIECDTNNYMLLGAMLWTTQGDELKSSSSP